MKRFYHRGLRAAMVLCASLALLPGSIVRISAAPATQLPDPKSPPRTIDDLTRQLDHYKPDPQAAAKALAEANAPDPVGLDTGAAFDFYVKRAQAAANVGRMTQQLRDFRKATELGKGGSKEEVQALRDLSTSEIVGGNLLRAIQVAEEATGRVDRKNLGQALGAYQQLAQMYVLVGDFDKAAQALKQAENTFSTLRSSKNWSYYADNWAANLERARGELFRAEGRMIEAEGAYRKGLRSLDAFLNALRGGMQPPNYSPYDQMRSERFKEVLLRNLAQSLMGQNKFVDAEVYLRQALRLALERVGRYAADTGTTLMQLSNCLSEQGRYADASRLAEEANRSFEQAGAAPESLFLANSRRALASSYVSQGRYADALAVFERMQQGLAGDPVLLQKLGAGDLDWVLALLRERRPQEAEKMARALMEQATKRQSSGSRQAEIRGFLAMTQAANGDKEGALAAFRQAVPKLIASSRSDEESGTGSVKRQQRLVILIESYLQLLFESTRSSLSLMAQAAAETFSLADIARGSAVQQALTASAARASITDPKLAELARQEQDAQRRIISLSELLTQLLAAPPEQQLPQVQAKMRADIDTLKSDRSRLKKQIAEQFPEYAELVDPKPATLAQAQKLLKADEALVAWYFGTDASYVWAVNSSGQIAFNGVPYTRTQMASVVRQLRKALDPGVATIDDIPAFDVNLAHQAYEGLLAPVRSVWQGRLNLLAIPHAELGQLPLSVLPTQTIAAPGKTAIPFTDYRKVPWLARDIAVTQLPSVTALASLRRTPASAVERRTFIGFGDPLFSADQARQVEKQSQNTVALATRGAPLKLRNVPQLHGVSSAELALLPRLPDTSQEIREIASVLKADPEQDIYLQKRATVRAVLSADLSRRQVVMFATHGLVPGELDGLNQPALALTSPEVADPDSDGLLTMDRILGLKLNADWVVLSACNTAAGDGTGSEAVSGLGRAFFYAGARALLVSNWPVETVAARKLMTDLFRRQVGAQMSSKSEALRQSMLALIDSPGHEDEKAKRVIFSYAHPLFWAPFVVVGD